MNKEIVIVAIENLSAKAAEEIIQIFINDNEEQAALEIIREHGEVIFVADDGNAEVEYDWATSAQEAANAYVEDGDWGDQSKSDWVTVYTWSRWQLGDVTIDDEDSRESHSVEIEPEEPECSHDDGHDWHSPHEVVGGIEDNPGVWGHGGGVICQEICRHCGCLKTTDTWAQCPDTGEQGLTSVEYDNGDHVFRDSWEEYALQD